MPTACSAQKFPGISSSAATNRSVCFFGEEDYRRYLDDLGELARRFGCAVHAFVLMTNHVHLLLTPEHADSVALMMKHLGQRDVQYVNRT
jgi:putative transposase